MIPVSKKGVVIILNYKKIAVIIVIIVVLLVLLMISRIWIEKPEPETAPEALYVDEDSLSEDLSAEDLEVMNNGNVSFTYSAGTGELKEIKGSFSSRKVTGEEEALRALLSVRSLFGIDSYDFYCSKTEERTGFRVYTLNQLYRGIPVAEGIFQLGADENGKGVFVRGNYVENIEADTTAQITWKEGMEQFVTDRGERIAKIRLVIYSSADTLPCLCWQYEVVSEDPLQDRIVSVDAVNGKVITEDRMNFAILLKRYHSIFSCRNK